MQIVNLLDRNRNRHSFDAEKANNPLSVEEFQSKPRGQIKMREGVAGEQRNVDRLTAIAPAMEFFEQWKECLQAFELKLSRYFSFKTVPGLNRIPLCTW